MDKICSDVTIWGQNGTKFVKMWQTRNKICHNMSQMWQTGDKICHNKRVRCDKLGTNLHKQNGISVRNVTNTLMHQTIVTKFVTSGTKMWQNTNPHKQRGCAVSGVCLKFCHISILFVTCLSPFCHAPKPRHINVCEGFDTKCDKISEITNNIFIFFKKILLAIYKYLSHLCIFYV